MIVYNNLPYIQSNNIEELMLKHDFEYVTRTVTNVSGVDIDLPIHISTIKVLIINVVILISDSSGVCGRGQTVICPQYLAKQITQYDYAYRMIFLNSISNLPHATISLIDSMPNRIGVSVGGTSLRQVDIYYLMAS